MCQTYSVRLLDIMGNKCVVPNGETFRYYLYFIQERMSIFWKKYECKEHLTDDPILQKYKFTNIYRACDRVSQYLIKDVIYKDLRRYTPADVLLRILVFKVFNKIETWNYISGLTDITIDSFNVERLSKALSQKQQICPIFSNANMMDVIRE